MNGRKKDHRFDRLQGLLRRRAADSARRAHPVARAGTLAALAMAGGDGAALDPPAWALEPDRIPWSEGAEYRYRLGSHRLALGIHGVTRRHEAAVGRAAAEFALVVEGPLLVFGSRFGDAMPWSWAAPYNWHFAPPAERVVPAAIDLTPDSYARLWATLWITLVDARDGHVRVCRAVALRPEFTHALHGVLREQALRPFPGDSADRALDGLRYSATPLASRALVRTRSAGVEDFVGRRAHTRESDTTRCTASR